MADTPTKPANATLRQRIAQELYAAGAPFPEHTDAETLAAALLPLVAAERADAVREAAVVVQPVLDELADYRNRINWETSCGGCARTLDGAVRETERAEVAEAAIARVRDAAQLHRKGLIGNTELHAVIDAIADDQSARLVGTTEVLSNDGYLLEGKK